MLVIGLTGSIGMGKTTTAGLFAKEDVAVLDSDRVVHDLYRDEAVALIEAAFPGSTGEDGVDRVRLGELLKENPANFKKLENIVHPLVQKKQQEFLQSSRDQGREFALLDIPLLFETGAERRVDTVVVVTCDADVQRERVLSRPGMTPEKFELILSRQMPDAEKRRRADFIIDTGHGIEAAHGRVKEILSDLAGKRDAGKKDA
ncbi:dephospho-CoA kinase [Rhizobium sp. RM]|uniref:dephospho-CoA kinase n=1 Tax=Rhizobium sp. RM TaxID=2748079 RepID=UPI00110E34AA|nr:dephospho-CoA kinase [Rhizobium sp. RM]NWJ23132.1 dephospho-CoA kinase [Rhizobium sp. RM]TMV14020.1 dephospho-CoA kinase [Rhizobium sp. Td3]